jgi:hypothetical protein
MNKIRFIVNDVERFSTSCIGNLYDFNCINMHISKIQEFETGIKRFNWNAGNKIFLKRLIDSGNVELVSRDQMFLYENDVQYVPTFFVVTIPEINGMFETGWLYWLTDNVKQFLARTGIPILLTQPGEYGFSWLSSAGETVITSGHFIFFNNRLSDEGLTNNVVIHNMSKIYMNVNPTGRIYHSIYSRQWIEHVKITSKDGLITYEDHLSNIANKKAFFCSNRAPREYRCLLFLNLLKNNNLDKGYFSFLAESPANVKMTREQVAAYFSSLFEWTGQHTEEEFKDYVDQALDMLPLQLNENVELRKDHVITNRDINQYRLNSFVELVTETHDITKESLSAGVLSEKTFWPIINQMPFINLGHRRNNELLKELGFETFENDFSTPVTTGNMFQKIDYVNGLIAEIDSMSDSDKFNWYNNIHIREKIKHNYNLLVNTDWNENEIDALTRSYFKTV